MPAALSQPHFGPALWQTYLQPLLLTLGIETAVLLIWQLLTRTKSRNLWLKLLLLNGWTNSWLTLILIFLWAGHALGLLRLGAVWGLIILLEALIWYYEARILRRAARLPLKTAYRLSAWLNLSSFGLGILLTHVVFTA